MSKEPNYPSTVSMQMPQVVGKISPSAPVEKSDRDPPPSATFIGGSTQADDDLDSMLTEE